MANPTTFSWTIPTTNVDGTPIAAGEITGFKIGIRHATDPQPAQNGGVYPINMPVDPATATTDLLTELSPPLAPGSYFAAGQVLSATNGNSSWTNEVSFTILAAPNPPGNFTVA